MINMINTGHIEIGGREHGGKRVERLDLEGSTEDI